MTTKNRILDATVLAIKSDGIVSTSARTIAKHGKFNQALIFYHFGSIENLYLEVLKRSHARRMATYGETIKNASSLKEIVDVALVMRAAENQDAAVLASITAGSSTNEMGARNLELIQEWNECVEIALNRLLKDTPFAALLPTKDIAFAIDALFIGVELIGRLDPSAAEDVAQLYRTFESLSSIGSLLLNQPQGANSKTVDAPER